MHCVLIFLKFGTVIMVYTNISKLKYDANVSNIKNIIKFNLMWTTLSLGNIVSLW